MVDKIANFILASTINNLILFVVVILIVIAWQIGFGKILYWLITKAMEETAKIMED